MILSCFFALHDSAKTETLVNLPKCVKKQFSFAEIALLVQLHFKAFLVKLRKARVQYLRSVPDDILGHLSTL